MITYQSDGIKMPVLKKREVSTWIRQVAESYGKRVGEIAYIFCSDERILEVNREYLQHDYYTDIITLITVKAVLFPAIYSSAWIRCAPMPGSLAPRMKKNFTAW